jgi:predicted naringenin-chalcone synthase
MNGLRVAQAYAAGDPNARILLCAAETCSLHFQYGWGQDRLVANSLFADGAAAVLIQSQQSMNSESPSIIDSASYIIPDSGDQMLWRIGDNGFEMHLASTVPSLIEEWLPTFLSNWLAEHKLAVADIAGWSVHPGGPKILDAVQSSLNLAPESLAPSREILATCGNMSSPTVFFILQKLQRRNVKGHCVVLGFGPGLTVEAALLKL